MGKQRARGSLDHLSVNGTSGYKNGSGTHDHADHGPADLSGSGAFSISPASHAHADLPPGPASGSSLRRASRVNGHLTHQNDLIASLDSVDGIDADGFVGTVDIPPIEGDDALADAAGDGGGDTTGAELVAVFRATGSQAAFEEIVRRYGGMVFATCNAVTKDRHDAEDVAQAVFLTLAVQVRTHDLEIRKLGPWLAKVAHRLALDHRKSAKRRKAREERHGLESQNHRSESGDHAAGMAHDDLRRVLSEELDRLPPRYRMPLILHYYGGMTREQMARELNCKPATLGVRIFRGREMLSSRLAGRGVVLGAAVLSLVLAETIRGTVAESALRRAAWAAAASAATSSYSPMVIAQASVPASVLELAQAAGRMLTISRFRTVASLLLAAGILGAGARVVASVDGIGSAIPRIINLLDGVAEVLRELTSPASGLRVQADAPADSPVEPRLSEMTFSIAPQVSFESSPLPAARAVPVPPTYRPPAVAQASEPSRPAYVAAIVPTPRVSKSSQTAALPHSGPAGPTKRWVREASALPVAVASASDSAEVSESRPVRRAGSSSSAPVEAPVAVLAFGKAVPLPTSPSVTEPVDSEVDAGASVDLVVGNFNAVSKARAGSAALTHQLSSASTLPADLQVVSAAPSGLSEPSRWTERTLNALQPQARPVLTVDAAREEGISPAVLSPVSQYVISAAPTSSQAVMIRGAGEVPVTGTLDQSGIVIADGDNAGRALDFASAAAVVNSLDNPVNGLNGWYSVNGGRLRLPATVSEQRLTWGESDTDRSLDLVNSLRIVGDLEPQWPRQTISLIAADSTDIPLRNQLASLSAVWEFDPPLPTSDVLEITVRGNPLESSSTLPGVLMALGDAGWLDITAEVDASGQLVTGKLTPEQLSAGDVAEGETAMLRYLALTVPLDARTDTSASILSALAGTLPPGGVAVRPFVERAGMPGLVFDASAQVLSFSASGQVSSALLSSDAAALLDPLDTPDPARALAAVDASGVAAPPGVSGATPVVPEPHALLPVLAGWSLLLRRRRAAREA